MSGKWIWNQGTGLDMVERKLEEKTHTQQPTVPTVLERERSQKQWDFQLSRSLVNDGTKQPLAGKKRKAASELRESRHIAHLDEDGLIICPKCGEELELSEEEEEASQSDVECLESEDEWSVA